MSHPSFRGPYAVPLGVAQVTVVYSIFYLYTDIVYTDIRGLCGYIPFRIYPTIPIFQYTEFCFNESHSISLNNSARRHGCRTLWISLCYMDIFREVKYRGQYKWDRTAHSCIGSARTLFPHIGDITSSYLVVIRRFRRCPISGLLPSSPVPSMCPSTSPI